MAKNCVLCRPAYAAAKVVKKAIGQLKGKPNGKR